MPEISAFRGLRYDLGHVGALESVVTPPLEWIDPPLQKQLYERHPSNAIRLVMNREELGDSPEAKFDRAGRFLKNWQREGVLQREPDPAIYVYHQATEYEGSTFVRQAFICLTRLSDMGQRDQTLLPPSNTETVSLKLARACLANVAPIVGMYSDPNLEIQGMLGDAITGQTPISAQDDLGTTHRLWPITDIQTIQQLATAFAPLPIGVVEGHTPLRAARELQAELTAQDGNYPGSDWVMTVYGAAEDPGLLSLPLHLVLEAPVGRTSEQLREHLSKYFDVQVAGEGAAYAKALWERMEVEDDQSQLALYCAGDDQWLLAKLHAAGRDRMATLAPNNSDTWRSLGVTILQRLVLDEILAAKQPSRCFRLASQISEAFDSAGGSTPSTFAAMALPPSIDQANALARTHESLPHGRSYLFPSVLSGLVLHTFHA